METSSGRQLRPETNCLMLRQGGKATASENGPWPESNWMRLGSQTRPPLWVGWVGKDGMFLSEVGSLRPDLPWQIPNLPTLGANFPRHERE